MIRQIGLASVYVTDQDRALEFYTGKLGFEVISDQTLDGYRWIEVAPPGAETGLTLAGAGPGSGWERFVGGFGSGYIFFCDSVHETYEQLKANGVDFTDEPSRQPWGMQAIFTDPDGNVHLLSDRRRLREAPQI